MSVRAHFESLSSYLPVDLSHPTLFLISILVVFAFVLGRYFLLVGMFYYFFWRVGLDQPFSPRVLHDHQIKPGQMSYEIKWSFISSWIFAFFGVTLGWLWQNDWTKIYLEFDKYGLFYLPLSLFIISIIHEVYFYFTHVWMHWPRVFRAVHAVHHYSRKTSPWASFSFHPLEAMIQAAFIPLVVLIVPIHPTMLLAYLTFMTLTAISNHLGYELIGPSWIRSFFISGSHHSSHHEKYNSNFGLYFTFIDRWMGTEDSSFLRRARQDSLLVTGDKS